MDAELAPFMSGEVRIFDMRLVRPKAIIAVAEDGAVDWAVRPSVPFDIGHITLESLTITEGQIVLQHGPSGRSHVLSEINTAISARALNGPWRVEGTLRVDGARAAVSVSTGKVDEAGAMRVRLRADPAVYPFATEMDGDVRIKDGAVTYAGTFKLDARSVSRDDLRGTGGQTFALNDDGKGKPLPPPYRLKGKFALEPARLAIDEFRLETGPLDDPYTADGKAVFDLGTMPRFEVTADGAQVRFDQTIAEASEKGGLTLAERIAALEAVLIDLPRPTMPGTVEIKLPAVVAGDTTIRDVQISAEPAELGWNIRTLAATLPGRTKLEGSGLLVADEAIAFKGDLLVAVGQPSGFAAWVSADVDEAIRRLPSAGFHAKVDLSRDRQRFDELELALGAAKFAGTIDRSQSSGQRPSVVLRLEGGALDIDGLTAFASLFVSDTGVNRAAETDVDLDLKAGPVAAAGFEAGRIDTALRIRGGTLEIERLKLEDIEDANIAATGRLTDFASRPAGKLDVGVVAVDLAPLVARLAEAAPGNPVVAELARRSAGYPGLFADSSFNVLATIAPEGEHQSQVVVKAGGVSGGMTFSLDASGTAEPVLAATRPFSLRFSGESGSAEQLAALYGLPTLPLGLLGAATTTLELDGTLADGLKTQFSLAEDTASATFGGTVRWAGGGFAAEGAGRIAATDIEPWLMMTGVSLPGMGVGSPVSLTADISAANGTVVLRNLAGTVEEGTVGGEITATLVKGIPHLTGSLSLDALDLATPVAAVVGEASLVDVEGDWPQTPFAAKVITPFTAELSISAGSVETGLFGSVHDASMSVRLDADGFNIADLKARAHDGELSGLFELKNTAGTALFSAQARLDGADLALLVPGADIKGRASITANLTSSGKSVEAMVTSLSGSGTALLADLSVPGLDPSALPALIKAADAAGRDIDAARVAAFAPALVAAGRFDASSAEIAFAVANGTLRAPPVTLAAAGASLTTELRADAVGGAVAASGEMAFDAGDEALVGSEPSVGFSVEGTPDTLVASLDTEPLAQFLTQRALEIEQARVEAMQSVLLEKQRLRREVRYYAALQTERERTADALRKAEEAARARAEADAKAKAEAEASAKAEAEARARAEDAARADADARARAEAKAREDQRIEQQRQDAERRKAEEQTRLPAGDRIDAAGGTTTGAAVTPVERSPLPVDRPAGEAPAPSASAGEATFGSGAIDSFLKTLRID